MASLHLFMARKFRSLSVTWQLKKESGGTARIQGLSSHLSSLASHSDEEYTTAVQAWSGLLLGSRRWWVITGMGANIQLSEARSRTTGSVLAGTASSLSSPCTRRASSSLLDETEMKGMMFLNTLASWWYKRSDFSDEDKKTWQGALFGRAATASIDYLLADRTTASSILDMLKINSERIGIPTDHDALLTTFQLQVPVECCARAHRRKPIGWRPRDADSYDERAKDIFERRGIMTIGSVTKELRR